MQTQELTNPRARAIAQRLSLRAPQVAALELLTRIYAAAGPHKGVALDGAADAVRTVLAGVAAAAPALAQHTPRHALLRAAPPDDFASFQRQFLNLCFALATGVGKTRLMGAFVAWLYLEHGMRHFFVVAPNLTIYRKLVEDFGDPTSAKYVFKGLAEFVTDRPLVITGDDYETGAGVRDDASAAPWLPGVRRQLGGTVHINIFNISKLSKDANPASRGQEAGKPPRFKRLQDCLGTSYFGYLADLTDLVLIMDEAHNYRADAAMAVLDDLQPVLGLELTATPFRTKGQKREWFGNIVYHYQLRDAMTDDLVKLPEVAYRKNLDAAQVDKNQLERMKLDDAIALHEETRSHLQAYAQQTGQRAVKPFVLVVASNIEHAKQLQATIESNDFYGGFYCGKTVRIDSKQGSEEKAKNTEELLKVERPDSPVEIVLHVESLEEGWDVTNLYTILPLRAADSPGLVLQSIGRGLRLPYGRRALPSRFQADTPERKTAQRVDRLTIVAHDRYDAILNEAKQPDTDLTGLVRERDLDEERPAQARPQVSMPTAALRAQEAAIAKLTPANAPAAQQERIARHIEAIAAVLPSALEHTALVRTAGDLTQPEVIAKVAGLIERALAAVQETAAQGTLLPAEELPTVKQVLVALAPTYVEHVIEVPKIAVVASADYRMVYHPFELDLRAVNWTPAARDLVRRDLTNQDAALHYVAAAKTLATEARLQDYLVRQLYNYDDVRYEDAADVIQDLADQFVQHLRTVNNGDDDAVLDVLVQHEEEAGRLVYQQLIAHRTEVASEWLTTISPHLDQLRPTVHQLSAGDTVRDFKQPLAPGERGQIKRLLFGGFSRCGAQLCKFDSEPELLFAHVLESDDRSVLRWMKPKTGQLQLRWRHEGKERNYEPDFVVETTDGKWLIEIKAANAMNDPEVLAKKAAAEEWCAIATEHAAEHGGKPWRYKVIPDNKVHKHFDFGGVLGAV